MSEFDPSKVPADTFCTETHIGPTPNGGVYSIAYYSDKWHEPCRKDEAAYVEISEYDADGCRVGGVYGQMFEDRNTLFTREEKEYFSKIKQIYDDIMAGKSQRLTFKKYGIAYIPFDNLKELYYRGKQAGII